MLRDFGTLIDGRKVQAATLSWPGGITVEILDYGAAVRALTVPGASGPVQAVLGFATLAEYEADGAYQGVVIGRCANRIAGARFEIDGESFQVTANEGENCLHGGTPGFDKRLWTFEAGGDERSVALTYVSPAGEEGFPGEVRARVSFTLTAADCLEIGYEATTDAPTPVNMTHHLYFNLSGDHRRPVMHHELSIAASAITPVRSDLIPTGELLAVEGTAFDLRKARPIGEALGEFHRQTAIAGGYDHNWVLDPAAVTAVRLHSPESGVAMTLATDQPGLQVYSGQGLTAPFASFAGLALEPQGFPNAVNTPGFPPVTLRAGETWRRRAAYRFAWD